MGSRSAVITALAVILFLTVHSFCMESAFEWPTVRSGQALLELRQPLNDLKAGSARTGLPDLDRVLEQISATAISPVAPKYRPDLCLVAFDQGQRVEDVVNLLKGSADIADAWPCPLLPWEGLTYVPDDLLLPSQWHISQIQSTSAWGIYRGSDTVQVGIIDGGVDYDHPDLAGNIWVNPGEDLNGNRVIEPEEWDMIDNDSNGYIDDFWGWDWINLSPSQVWPGEDPGPPDNDPSDFGGHGTHCAGDACAATDNSLGVAAPGFNCQIMALRAGYLGADGQGYVDLSAAIPAVYYAIDMDAEVLSMSFGGSSYAPFQAVLQTASDSGLVLVAAAGNEHTSQISYPAGYDFVIAVAATAQGDVLAGFSNYGDWITVCAPGVDIMSTTIGSWGNMSGTSMATPITAGVAALVKSLMPEWSSTQVGQWLARSADNIDQQNPSYVGMLGGGRLNAAHAVDLFVSVDSLWTQNAQGGSRLSFAEEGSLFVRYHKYFGTATNVVLTMSSTNPRVTFSQAVHNIGALTQGQSGDNSGNPFRFTVQFGGLDYEIVELDAHFSGDGFDFTQVLDVPVGRGQILIIDADQNQTKQTSTYYEQVLDELGLTWETWRRSEIDSLGSELSNYDAVIHFSGTAQTNIFPSNDWQDLDNYLDNGGHLIVSGQNVAQDLAATQPLVLENILRVQYLAPSSGNMTVRGSPGNPLTEGMELIMIGSGGAWNQNSMDKVAALLGAEPWFVYHTETPTELAGVRTRVGQSDLFFCAFGIESINDPSSTNTRYDILSLMLEQFGVVAVEPSPTTILPSETALLLPHPNPFNSEQQIAYHLPEPGPVKIEIYDLLGRLVANHFEERAPAGRSSWLWRADPELSSGLYFIRLQASGQVFHQKTVYLK